jgi:hypothetical protein
MRTRRSQPRDPNTRPDSRCCASTRNPTRGRLLRSRLERSRRCRHMGSFASWCRMAIRRQSVFRGMFLSFTSYHPSNVIPVQPRQRPTTYCTSPSTGQRRLQIPLQRQGRCYCLVRTQLLLPLRQRRVHYESRRRPQARVPNLLRRPRS